MMGLPSFITDFNYKIEKNISFICKNIGTQLIELIGDKIQKKSLISEFICHILSGICRL